jgi:photosystem II stability/assembly factor-like uncharacterized protein
MASRTLLLATGATVYRVEPEEGRFVSGRGLEAGVRPTCLAADPREPARAWCGTTKHGVLRTGDGGRRWRPSGLEGIHVTALAPGPSEPGLLWAGTEPSRLYRSRDHGEVWEEVPGMERLPSASEWSFPPKPETHHVRWITCHPGDPGLLWLAVEAGALIATPDGGDTWRDRVPGGPTDTHELALHPDRPEGLRSAAGDGYFESDNGGLTWARPMEGLEVGYLRSVAVDPGDPEAVLVSGATRPKSTYVAGHSDGRVYRREGKGVWTRVVQGWPDPPDGIAPLLVSGFDAGEFWGADDRGVFRSGDGGRSWSAAARFGGQEGPARPTNLRGLVVSPAG